jgi:hypothetical protein
MAKSDNWGHTKSNLEKQSRSERRKGLQELGKQDDKLDKLVAKLKRNARRETDEGSNDNG